MTAAAGGVVLRSRLSPLRCPLVEEGALPMGRPGGRGRSRHPALADERTNSLRAGEQQVVACSVARPIIVMPDLLVAMSWPICVRPERGDEERDFPSAPP